MSNPTPDTTADKAPEEQGFPFYIATAVLIVVASLAYALYSRASNSNADTAAATPSEKPPFDPAAAAELEIKGERPDGTVSWSAIPVSDKPELTPALATRGKDLFAKGCAGCHGAEGQGDGPVRKRFDFVSFPADLTRPAEAVKIRTTMMESVPLDGDLFRTLTRGLPGTAMWSFRKLPEADRWALVAFLKTLAPAAYATQPDPVKIPPKPENTEELRDTGGHVFKLWCQNCHGMDGMGPTVPMVDQASRRPFPGIPWARKGGTEMLSGSAEDDFARTLLTGFHRRSPMLSFRNALYGSPDPNPKETAEGDEKLWGTVFFCRELVKRTGN